MKPRISLVFLSLLAIFSQASPVAADPKNTIQGALKGSITGLVLGKILGNGDKAAAVGAIGGALAGAALATGTKDTPTPAKSSKQPAQPAQYSVFVQNDYTAPAPFVKIENTPIANGNLSPIKAQQTIPKFTKCLRNENNGYDCQTQNGDKYFLK